MSEREVTHYRTLRATRRDSTDEIRKLYIVAASKAHPDKGGSIDDFKRVQEAWAVLKSPQTRAAYHLKLTALGSPCAPCSGKGAVRRQQGFAVAFYEFCETCGGSGVT